jgi:hypothetical protein
MPGGRFRGEQGVIRPLAAFGSFGYKTNDGNNNFNMLQASLQRRFTRGLLFQMNYMWPHGIADASIGSGEAVAIQNMGRHACDRSSTSIDVRHVMTMNAVYQLPFGKAKRFLNAGGAISQFVGGWELAGIASARTGLPVNITVSRTAAALLDGNTSGPRPNLVPGVPIYAVDQNIDNWFNPAAFSAPANLDWGNLGRYIANGPGAYEIDSSLQKRFHVTEHVAPFPCVSLQPVESSRIQDSGRQHRIGRRQRHQPLHQADCQLRQDHGHTEHGRDGHRCASPHRVPVPR